MPPGLELKPDYLALARRRTVQMGLVQALSRPAHGVSLVSEEFQFGGTFDATLIGERRAMCDYKTAARLYEEHLVQLAAYGHLWNEHHPDRPIDGGFYLLRFSRVHGDFTAHRFTELDDAWEAFKHCRGLYDLKAKLKGRCG